MNINIVERNINLSEERRAMIKDKVSKLSHLADRVQDESTEIKIEVEHEESRVADEQDICKITIFVPQDTLRAEARSDSLINALDDAISKINPQLERYKDKMHHISERTK